MVSHTTFHGGKNMSRLTQSCIAGLLSAVLVLGAAGCQEKNTGFSEADQAAAYAAERIRDLEAQIAQAQRDRAAGQDQLLAMQNELNRLREQLAHRPEPAPAPGWQSVPGGAMISIEGLVLFDSGKSELKPTARQTLDDVARTINQRFPEHDIYVFGHTDDVPIRVSSWKDNYELSCQRALSVVRFMASARVAANMAACGWGETRPVSPGTDSASRQANRRVEIFAMTPAVATAQMASPPALHRVP
jgi:chemotaxis protein MotB